MDIIKDKPIHSISQSHFKRFKKVILFSMALLIALSISMLTASAETKCEGDICITVTETNQFDVLLHKIFPMFAVSPNPAAIGSKVTWEGWYTFTCDNALLCGNYITVDCGFNEPSGTIHFITAQFSKCYQSARVICEYTLPQSASTGTWKVDYHVYQGDCPFYPIAAKYGIGTESFTVTSICAVGSYRCSSNKVQQCYNNQWNTIRDCDLSGEICHSNGLAYCMSGTTIPSCQLQCPNKCYSSGTTEYVMSNGYPNEACNNCVYPTLTPCSTDKECSGGTCISKSATTKTCSCGSTTLEHKETCSIDEEKFIIGFGWKKTGCAMGYICDGTTGQLKVDYRARVKCYCNWDTSKVLQIGENCVIYDSVSKKNIQYECYNDNCNTDSGLIKISETTPTQTTTPAQITTPIVAPTQWACTGDGCKVECTEQSTLFNSIFYCEWVDWSKMREDKVFSSVEEARNYLCTGFPLVKGRNWDDVYSCNYEGKEGCTPYTPGIIGCCPGLICQKVPGKLVGICQFSEKCVIQGGSLDVPVPEATGTPTIGGKGHNVMYGGTCETDQDCIEGLTCQFKIGYGNLCLKPGEGTSATKSLLDLLGLGGIVGEKYCAGTLCFGIFSWIIIIFGSILLLSMIISIFK